MQGGRLDEAARLWRQVLGLSPDHPQALFHLGQEALQRRDFAQARAFLQRAAGAAPQNAVIPLNLAFVFRAMGDTGGEMDALTRALVADPYFYPALLSKGALLERLGQPRQAAQVYKDLLTILPPPNHVPMELQEPIARARALVLSNGKQMERQVEASLAQMRAKHAGAKLDRFEECRDVMLGFKKVYTVQPTLLHFPRLPAIAFHDNADFPRLAGLEAQTAAIREELLAMLDADKAEFTPYVTHPKGAPLDQWAELNYSPRWSAFFLWKDGKRLDDHCARCPRTAEALAQAGMAQVPGYAPTAFFSVLEPHTHIPPHTGVTNTRLVVHLPLILPGNCRFRVGNETRDWEMGKAWVFDDTIEHEAWNDSDQTRVILIIDVWNPLLSEAERDLVSALLGGVAEYYRGS